MNDAIVTLKPSVQALLELHPFKRGAGWMDDLTRAVFDLPPDAPFTPEQRNFTKRYLHAFVYQMTPMNVMAAYASFFTAAERASRENARLNSMALVHHAAYGANAVPSLEANKGVIQGQGWSRPKPRGTY